MQIAVLDNHYLSKQPRHNVHYNDGFYDNCYLIYLCSVFSFSPSFFSLLEEIITQYFSVINSILDRDDCLPFHLLIHLQLKREKMFTAASLDPLHLQNPAWP